MFFFFFNSLSFLFLGRDGAGRIGRFEQALSMAATATTAVGGEGNGGSMNVIKAAALAVYSVAVSVQPAILVLATKVIKNK